MGDILGRVFGGGKQTNQTTTPDENAAALNELKRKELEKLFAAGDMASFARANRADYTLSPKTAALIDKYTNTDNLLSLQDYIKMGLDEGKGYINKVATPEIQSMLALQGMGRSGALPESIAKATAGIALPFLTSLPSFMTGSAQQAQTMAGLSDMPRVLRAEDFNRRQGVVQTGFTGIPFAPGSSTKGGESQLPLFNLFGFGGSV
jgi:hypothetical protein